MWDTSAELEGTRGGIRFATTAERFGGGLDVGTAMELGPEPGFGVIAIGLAPDGAGPLVAALAVHLLAREGRAARGLGPQEAAERVSAAFEATDAVLARLGGKGVVDDEEAAAALAAQGFSVPGSGPTSAVVRGPLCASAALVGCWGGAIVTAHVGDASVWRGRGGQWGRVGLPHTLQQAYGASIPTGWEDEMTRVLGTGVGERGTVLVGEAREGDAWAITVGAGGHTRALRRDGSGARVRIELGG